MTEDAPDIEQTLIDFGNTAKAIPYYAVYRPDEEPHHFDGNFVASGARGFLKTAGISEKAPPAKDTGLSQKDTGLSQTQTSQLRNPNWKTNPTLKHEQNQAANLAN